MFRPVFSSAVVALATLSGTIAHAITINFDTLSAGDVVTTQYSGVMFSSEPGFENRVLDLFDLGSSPPNYMCTGAVGGSLDCTHDTFLEFSQPVRDLTFLAVGVDERGVVAKVDVFENAVLSATIDVIGNGTNRTPDPVDLSAFSNVTRIAIRDITDGAGIGWDDFRFTLVPEPPSLWPLLLCAGGARTWNRKRRLTA